MTNFVYIAASIDGYIAAVDGGVGWLDDIPHPDASAYGFESFMDGVDALVMGRHTFEKVLSFGQWPYEKPVFVVSSQLREVPEQLRHEVEIISGASPDLVESLNGRGYRNLYIDGGQLITGFLGEDLIDEMIISTIPVLLGSGIPLFGHFATRLHFTLLETKSYSNSLIMNHYQRTRPETENEEK
jgi:dihydrofolate reductase